MPVYAELTNDHKSRRNTEKMRKKPNQENELIFLSAAVLTSKGLERI